MPNLAKMKLPDRRIAMAWAFIAAGVFQIVFTKFVVYTVLRVEFWAGLLFPGDEDMSGTWPSAYSPR